VPANFPPIQALASVAHKWINTISGAGVASATQPASTDLSDLTATTNWTPTDQSGASLSLTVNQAKYYQIGKIVYIEFDITYPSTGNTNLAQISLPVAPLSTTSQDMGGVIFNTLDSAHDRAVVHAGGTAAVYFCTVAQGFATNANMSGTTLRGGFVYLGA
jgi:hypothetical protein